MADSWEDRKRAKEEEYFERANREAMERVRSRGGGTARKSPITGEPMVQETVMGVVIDRCPTSGGVWLDAGELDEIIKAATDTIKSGDSDRISGFFESLFKKRKQENRQI